VSHILEDLPDSFNEEELVEEIIGTLIYANYESDELTEKNNNEYKIEEIIKESEL
jgi:hypothetical protein